MVAQTVPSGKYVSLETLAPSLFQRCSSDKRKQDKSEPALNSSKDFVAESVAESSFPEYLFLKYNQNTRYSTHNLF
jgi:hypothetical protein